ncbi:MULTISPECIES: hypothetical protein [Sphingobacterium]|nr:MULTISPECIES: hypothetical protein [Sphingobacterium]HAU52395.1 hypothetical protein [Sphingobacterium sp.]HCX56491.1 hypothetical protein [Sphingobacterium sp.]
MKSKIEVMKSHFFTRNFIWLLILLFIVVSCQKDSSQVLDNENKPTLADIKEFYAKEGIFKKINPNDNLPIQWEPLWDEVTVRKANDSVEYMFIPLHPFLKEDKKKITFEKGGKTYLLVKNGKEFYKGFFFNDTKEEITDLRSFTGKMLFTNLKSNAANLIKYRNGSPYFEGDENVQKKRASSTKMAWEQNCNYQTVDCIYQSGGYGCGSGITIYHSRDCSYPSFCAGYGWSLIDSRDEYVCENVWVPDAPGTGDGGGGSDGSDIANFNAKIDDTNLPDCMKGVSDTLKMLNGNSVADIIKKFSGEIPGYNLKFTTENFSDPMKVAGTNRNNNTGEIIIAFNTNPLVIGNVSDLAFATTMLHESIHAYLTAFFYDDPTAATMTYPQLFEKYTKKKAFSNGAQHETIARDFITDLAASIKNYGELKGYHLDKQIYDDIAWKGLLETDAFKNLSDVDKSRITDRIMAEQYDTRKDKGVTQKGVRMGC